jgi:hypothetical protein
VPQRCWQWGAREGLPQHAHVRFASLPSYPKRNHAVQIPRILPVFKNTGPAGAKLNSLPGLFGLRFLFPAA